MPFLQTADAVNSRPSVDSSEAGDLVSVRAEFSLAAALAAGDIIEMLKLPAGHVPVDFILDADDLDTNGAPTIALDVGIMSGAPGVVDGTRTVGQQVFAGSTVAQAGGVARPTLATAFRIAPADIERSIGIKVATGPATGAAAGKIGLTIIYRPSRYGV